MMMTEIFFSRSTKMENSIRDFLFTSFYSKQANLDTRRWLESVLSQK